MNTTTWSTGFNDAAAPERVPVVLPPSISTMPSPPLHRLAKVRRREGVTLREVARHLGISIRQAQEQEQPTTDLPLSTIYRWQKVLGVPVAELLVEPEGELSPPVELRAHLLRAMKTIRSVQEVAKQASVQRLAETLVGQLVEVMPELKDTVAWPSVGHRRRQDELGQAYYRGLSLDPLEEPDGEA